MVELSNLKPSDTKKHFSVDASIEPFAWEKFDAWSCHIRVVSRVELTEKDFKKIVNETIDNKAKWSLTNKGNYQYKMSAYPATSIYITKLKEEGNEPDSSPADQGVL